MLSSFTPYPCSRSEKTLDQRDTPGNGIDTWIEMSSTRTLPQETFLVRDKNKHFVIQIGNRTQRCRDKRLHHTRIPMYNSQNQENYNCQESKEEYSGRKR